MTSLQRCSSLRTPKTYTTTNIGSLKLFFAIPLLIVLTFAQSSFAKNNVTDLTVDCSTFRSCGECTMNLECGFCSREMRCVQGGWNGPFGNPLLCEADRWEYQFGQCFVTHKQAILSATSALVGILILSLILCMCCCICRCCRSTSRSHLGNDEERNPLLGGESVATHHFRRQSFYNYNRNRPFERRGRTLSSGTTNSAMQYGRNWRNDEYMYGYGGPSMLWENEHNPPPAVVEDFSVGSQGNSVGTGEWRRWEKKREELLAKYGKTSPS